MAELTNREIVERFMQAMATHDAGLADQYVADDIVEDHPQSGERIVGGANRRAVYAAIPALPTLSPRRLIATGDMVVAELDYHGSEDSMAVFMFRLRDGQIIYQIAYWAQPFPAAAWRAAWVERK